MLRVESRRMCAGRGCYERGRGAMGGSSGETCSRDGTRIDIPSIGMFSVWSVTMTACACRATAAARASETAIHDALAKGTIPTGAGTDDDTYPAANRSGAKGARSRFVGSGAPRAMSAARMPEKGPSWRPLGPWPVAR